MHPPGSPHPSTIQAVPMLPTPPSPARDVLEAAAALESRFSSKACRGYGYSQIRPATKAVGASGSATKGKSGGDGFRSILVTSLPRTGKGAVSAKSGRKGGMKKKRRKKGSSKAGTSKMLNLNI